MLLTIESPVYASMLFMPKSQEVDYELEFKFKKKDPKTSVLANRSNSTRITFKPIGESLLYVLSCPCQKAWLRNSISIEVKKTQTALLLHQASSLH